MKFLQVPAMQPPVELPFDVRGGWVYADGSIGLVTLLLLAVSVLTIVGIVAWAIATRPRKQKKTIPVDPWDDLKKQVSSLKPQEPFTSDQQRRFYFSSTHLARVAIEKRSGLGATDMTVKELEKAIHGQVPLPQGEKSRMIQFLQRSELIKFADQESSFLEATQFHDQLIAWVEVLKPLSIHESDSEEVEVPENLSDFYVVGNLPSAGKGAGR